MIDVNCEAHDGRSKTTSARLPAQLPTPSRLGASVVAEADLLGIAEVLEPVRVACRPRQQRETTLTHPYTTQGVHR